MLANIYNTRVAGGNLLFHASDVGGDLQPHVHVHLAKK